MRTVLLVPRRSDGGGPRDRAWAWCRARWTALHPDLAIYEGPDDAPSLPFSRAASLNGAARLADADGRWDQAVVSDADVFLPPAQVDEAIARAAATGKVTWAFQRWNGLTSEATETLLALPAPRRGGRLAIEPDAIEKTNPISWSCCFVVPRGTWDDLGGFDERFRGWGWEDMAFQSVVCGIYGHERIEGDIYHLWHPRAEERIRRGQPDGTAHYRANRMLGRRYMYDLRRRGLHDRATDSDEAEMERDRENVLRLTRAEELDHRGQPRRGLPDWREWWPTLEELRDGAKAGRPAGPGARVAIVMRSGGTLVSWPDRATYLRRSLASLDEHLAAGTSTVVARVLFSDWPADVAAEVAAIAEAHGFYVVGAAAGNRGFTAAMRDLWRYLGTRSWSFDFAFLTEDDFELERDVDLAELAATLVTNPSLVQVALLRDAFYQAERDLGGILGHPATEFRLAGDGDDAGPRWLEHRRFFTLNPTLVRRSIFDRPWPRGEHTEAIFGRQLFAADAAARSALWGSGETWVRHLGEVRAGAGY